jgi:hypothetical protein
MKNTTANKGKITSSNGFPLWTKRNNKLAANKGITTQIQKAEKRSLILSLAIVKTSCCGIIRTIFIVLFNVTSTLADVIHMKLWIPLPCTLESSP